MSGELRPLHVFTCNKKNKTPAYITVDILGLADKKRSGGPVRSWALKINNFL